MALFAAVVAALGMKNASWYSLGHNLVRETVGINARW
jgi:hypothetical protein